MIRKIKVLLPFFFLISFPAFAGFEGFDEDTSPASGDLVVTQDISDTTDGAEGTTKKVQIGNLPFASKVAGTTIGNVPSFSDTSGALDTGYAVNTSVSQNGSDTSLVTDGAIRDALAVSAFGITSNMADDSAESIDAPQDIKRGVLIAWLSAANGAIFAQFRTSLDSANEYALSISSSSNFTVTTGALTGTTGADGDFTISFHSDGKIYFENRRGFNVMCNYQIFGMK